MRVASQWKGSPEGRRAAERFQAEYGGLEVTVLGGVLEGQVRLGLTRLDAVWRDRHGLEMFKCASHPTLQCTIVSTGDGRLGCSWSREFTPLFGSVDQFLDDAAMWRSVRGWTYVAVGDLPVDTVLEALAVSASGAPSSWWMSPELAVVAHPYLTPGWSTDPQVFVLAKTNAARESSRASLIAHGIGELPFVTGKVFGVVPRI